MNKTVFIFPGQGAQTVGMAKDFYDTFPIAKEMIDQASEILGMDMCGLLFEGPEEELLQTKNSQPAIFVASFAILRCLQDRFPHLKPWAAAGLSLGEYTALCATGRLPFEEGLKIVAARGAFMHEACLESPGQMKVVLGLEPDLVEQCLPEHVWIANLNCPGQVVIAGQNLDSMDEILKTKGAKRVLPLDVAGAFHTPLMRRPQEKLKPLLEKLNLQKSDVHLVMNVCGDVVEEKVQEQLILQVASPTKWEKGIRKLDEMGAELFVEIGPGKTLSGMNRKMGVKGKTINIEKVSDLDQICN
jgi:[acyl-carrier-protein] S-malonyltransferase